MATLYLTKQEESILQSLPETLRNGWQVEQEADVPAESDDDRRTRLMLARVRDPHLTSLVDKAKAGTSVEELADAIQEIDLSNASDADLGELFFALGPTPLSQIIAALLQDAQNDEQLADIESLAFIRHSLLSR